MNREAENRIRAELRRVDGAKPPRYECPVCYFPDLDESPAERLFNICPVCNTEFGLDDSGGTTYEDLRRRWLRPGGPLLKCPLCGAYHRR